MLEDQKIIPNAQLRLIGTAHLSSEKTSRTVKAGTVVETDDGALLLWLYIFPYKGDTIELTLEDNFEDGQDDVVVLVDCKARTPEFAVGKVAFDGYIAKVKMFGIPVFPATLLLNPTAFKRAGKFFESMPQQMPGHTALQYVR